MRKIVFIFVLLLIGIAPLIISSYSDYVSPKKQLESGVLPEDIQCRENKVLVIRDNGNPACVKEETAQKTGWDIIATEFAQKIIPSNQKVQINDKVENNLIEHESTVDSETNNNNEQEFIVLDLGSDVEYVDDGREQYRAKLQKSPAPGDIFGYIDEALEKHPVDAAGLFRTPAISHERYSVNPGVGFYPQDWMPSHVPDGYRLLYIDNRHYEEFGTYWMRIYFVPNTFELTKDITNLDLDISHGFKIFVEKKTQPLDEIEDEIENYRERIESDYGYVGRFLDLERDGKTVWASETQSDYNHYHATLNYNFDEYTIVGVSSNYHTLEELQPIFDSIMK